jgi:hypothetical protein
VVLGSCEVVAPNIGTAEAASGTKLDLAVKVKEDGAKEKSSFLTSLFSKRGTQTKKKEEAKPACRPSFPPNPAVRGTQEMVTNPLQKWCGFC